MLKTIAILSLPCLLLVACSGAPGTAGDRAARDGKGKAEDPPRMILDRTPDKDGKVKVLVYYDMEGISGIDKAASIDFPSPEYFEARDDLTADVNAVIDGFFAGGADSVFVVDAHGSFNQEPDIILEKMDPRAGMLFKNKKFDPYLDLLHENSYDAVAVVGMHSRTGGGGFIDHTINAGSDWIFNGMSVNESEILAYSWGRAGIPLILSTGDDKLAEQLDWMDWLECVTTKKAKGWDQVELLPVDEVRAELRASAERAIRGLDGMKAIKLREPIRVQLRAIPPMDLSLLENVPGVDYKDQTVTFTAKDFDEAYKGIRGILKAGQSGYYNIAAELFLNQGGDAFMRFKEAVFQVWKEAAPDTAAPPEPEPSGAKLYFGSR